MLICNAHVNFLFYFFLGATKEKIHESNALGRNFFNVLVESIKETIDERKIESKLNYYYQRLDTQDLVVAGRIGDVESNYQLLSDLETYISILEMEP